MEIRLLGPLEVVRDDGPRPLGGPKQRALLALLLLRANEVVSTDTIVDGLWADSPPPTAPAYVQNCVSRLRKTLGSELIETVPPGYVLRIDPETIDARRFERLVVEARGMPASERAGTLRAALALWRGDPLSDLAYESFAQGDIAALRELRRAAQEDRIEAELELGLHAELLGELEALARADPARERLRRLQMLALYRAGRQVDALAVYQETRLALVEEYGVEPSEELRALERMILTQDPALDVAAAPTPVAAEPGPIREVRKTVTVLFADVAGSTALGERLDPESLRRLLSRVFAVMRAAAEAHGGTVEKFSGDDVMAVFGVPATHEDDALRGIRAAVAMRESLSQLGDEVVMQWGTRLEVRIGLNTGEVIAGDAEGAEPFVTGDVVNVAKRIQQAAEPGAILVGKATRRLAGAVVEAEPLEPIDAHNRAAPIDAFRIVRLRDAPAPQPGELPLVGRADELERLRAAFGDVTESGVCRRVVIVGEPGIGKSRLAAELLSSLGGEATILTGRCVAYGEGATYLPLRDVLQQAAPGTGDMTARIASVLAGSEDGDVVAARLAGAVGGGVAGTSDEVFWAARRLLETIAEQRPLVVLFEDVHWAEPTFLDLVEYLAGWTQAPVLVLCLARPELFDVRPQWGEGALALGPLDEANARALVGALPGREAFSDDELPALLATAGGVPLFLEQLTALASERPVDGSAVPASVEALIASRLDRLDPWERGVLDRAAVAGREFWRGAVVELSPENERAAVGQRLLALARRRLIHPDRSALPGEDGFRFHHVLIRDVAYGGIPKAERARLHERLARWLDTREGELDELVGYHLEQAARLREGLGEADSDLAREAAARLEEAGLRALRRIDEYAAVNLLSRSTELTARDEPRRLELELALGTALKSAGDIDQMTRVFDNVVTTARGEGNRRIELRVLVEKAWPSLSRGEIASSAVEAMLEDAIEVFEEAADDLGLARAWHVTSVLKGDFRLRIADAETAAIRAQSHYEKAGFGDWCLTLLAVAACKGPMPVSAARSRIIELSDRAGTPYWRSFILPSLALVESMDGQFDLARDLLEESRASRHEFGDAETLATSWAAAAAQVELAAGNAHRAEAILRAACETLAASGDVWLATNTSLLAEALYRQGSIDAALRASSEAMALASSDYLEAQSIARRVWAKASAHQGRHDDALVHASETVELLREADELNERAHAVSALAVVQETAGRPGEARQSLREALELFGLKENLTGAEQARVAMEVAA